MSGFLKIFAYVYFIFFLVPAGIIQKMMLSDRLGLRFQKTRATYWNEKTGKLTAPQK